MTVVSLEQRRGRRRRLPAEDPRQRWGTPRLLGGNLCREFGCTIDLAADRRNALLPRFITREDDSLSIRWGPGWRGWLNPTYDKRRNSERDVLVMGLRRQGVSMAIEAVKMWREGRSGSESAETSPVGQAAGGAA